MLFGDEVGNMPVIDEIHFIVGRGVPFGRLASSQKRSNIVEPEFCDTIEVGLPLITRDQNATALDETAKPWNAGAKRSVDVFQ